jgi:hypothetical protein
MKLLPGTCLILWFSATVASANLVFNGGFETGNFSGWTQSGNPSFTFVDVGSAHSGLYNAFAGPMGSLGFLTQNISTVPAGSTYDLTFFLELASGQQPRRDHLEVSFSGITLLSIDNPPSSTSYQQFSFTNLLATGSSSSLQFGFRSDHGVFLLDDVSVVQHTIPEPRTVSYCLIAGVAFLLRLFQRNVKVPKGHVVDPCLGA